MKSDKTKKIYFAVLAVFVICFIGILVLYLIKKNNTSIIVQGNPRDLIIENYKGDLDFESITLFIADGVVTNRDSVSFEVDGAYYDAEPGELRLEFSKQPSYDGNGYYSCSLTNPLMYFSSTPSMDIYSYADEIKIINNEHITENDIDENGKKNQVTSEIVEVIFKNFSSDGGLYVEGNSTLSVDKPVIISYKGDTLPNSGDGITLYNQCEFALEDISEMEVCLMDSSERLSLNGQINKLHGTLNNEEAALYSTSGTSQSSFFCGNQMLNIAGKDLKAEYEYNYASADLMVNGKPQIARLEGIDILEGFVQYLLSNFDSFFLSFVGAALALAIDKTLKS